MHLIFLQSPSGTITDCSWVSTESVFAECRDRLGDDWMTYMRRCEYDMCAHRGTDNTPGCIWVLALARTCKELGVIVDWMTSPTLATMCQGFHDCATFM